MTDAVAPALWGEDAAALAILVLAPPLMDPRGEMIFLDPAKIEVHYRRYAL
jgi:hypothetical protein